MRTRGARASPPAAERETRLTLTTTPDPNDATRPEADEPQATDAAAASGPDPEPASEQASGPTGRDSAEEPTEPGVAEAIGGVRSAIMRMIDAHASLLRAELEIFGKEIGVIAGLAFGALFIAVLALILLYVGSFLFLGELLFGSMGWGIIHGTLLAIAFIGFVAINLAGGDVTRYGWGAAIGVLVAVLLAALMLSNVSNEGGESLREWIVEEFQTESLPFGEEWLVFLSGLVIGAILGLIGGLLAVWRTQLSGSQRTSAILAFVLIGAIALGILFPTRYAAPDGVLGLAIMVGLLVWIIAGVILAARAGFDPEARYANLIPRETIAAMTKTKEFVTEELERQKNRMMGR